MKYLIAQKRGDAETPVLFAAPLTHADMASMLKIDGYVTLSAGFVQFHPGALATTHDRSVSLNLAPRPHDAALITAHYAATLATLGLKP